jgi:hypothetical protein
MEASSPSKREGHADWLKASISVNRGEVLELKVASGDSKEGVLRSVQVAEGGKDAPSFMRSFGETVP